MYQPWSPVYENTIIKQAYRSQPRNPIFFTSCGIKARHLKAVVVRVTFKWKWLIKLMSWYKM